MRVASVTGTPLAVPFRRPFRWASGRQRGGNLVLWRVETDDGTLGHGESICEEPAAVLAYGRLVAQAFVGRPPGDAEAALGALRREGRWRFTPRWTNQVVAGIETACWDALGRALGVPVSTLLGGRIRDELDVMAFPQGEEPDELAAEAADLVAAGCRVVYLKVGRPRLADDDAVVAAVRAAIGPEPLLRVDANEAWEDAATAVERIRALERHGLDWVEQPTPADDVAALARVRRAVGVRVAADQAVYTAAELRHVLEREAADVVVVGAHETGGLWRLRQLAALAEAHGVPVNRHACVESALSTVAAAHALASAPNLTLGNQAMHQLLAEPLVAPSPDVRSGRLAIPDGPGLGVEPDADAVAAARDRYERDGAYPAVER